MIGGLRRNFLLTSSGDIICADATLAESENKNNNDRLRLFLLQGLCRCGMSTMSLMGCRKKKPSHTLFIWHESVQKGIAL